jgi:O-methyltransferase domain
MNRYVGVFPPLTFEALKYQVIASGVRLGIPQHLGTEPTPVAKLAADLGADQLNLGRLLRALSTVGFVEQVSDTEFTLTPLGAAFHPGRGDALHEFAATYGDPAIWRALGELEGSVRTGRSGFELANGTGLYQHLAGDETLMRNFNGTMAMTTRLHAPILVSQYDFSRARHIVDVGGGDGALLARVLRTNPAARGTVFDSAEGMVGLDEVIADAGLAGRLTGEAGDFLTGSVTPGADLYLIKNVLHDWPDETCVRILANCRAAAAEGATFLVLVPVIPDWRTAAEPGSAFGHAALIDVLMMSLTCRDRTLPEFESLFSRAGLAITRTIPLEIPGSAHTILEATAV